MSEQKHRRAGLIRREFLKSASLTGLAALAGGGALAAPSTVLAQSGLPQAPMPQRPFGRSGRMVSLLSLGGMFDILNNRLMLKQALDWDLTYWDTAEGYGGGRSEEGIGRWFARSPDTRREVFWSPSSR